MHEGNAQTSSDVWELAHTSAFIGNGNVLKHEDAACAQLHRAVQEGQVKHSVEALSASYRHVPASSGAIGLLDLPATGAVCCARAAW
jgi:hypothetical protein